MKLKYLELKFNKKMKELFAKKLRRVIRHENNLKRKAKEEHLNRKK